MNISPKVWKNGELIDWNDARIHVMSHVVNYGSSVFEGIRCYPDLLYIVSVALSIRKSAYTVVRWLVSNKKS